MEILGVVPARGGSKGIPRKNLAVLGGRPLIEWTADAVRASRTLSRTVVSTDDEEIERTARPLGLEVPFRRPEALAGDDVPILLVLRDLLATLGSREGYTPDAVVLLQPTSPFRTAEHIDAAVRMLRETGADSVVSVVEVPHQYNPSSLMRFEGGRLQPVELGPVVTRRQDKPMYYARNGPSVLVTRTAVLVDRCRLYGDECRGLVMAPSESIDIDTPWDLALAEFEIARRQAERASGHE